MREAVEPTAQSALRKAKLQVAAIRCVVWGNNMSIIIISSSSSSKYGKKTLIAGRVNSIIDRPSALLEGPQHGLLAKGTMLAPLPRPSTAMQTSKNRLEEICFCPVAHPLQVGGCSGLRANWRGPEAGDFQLTCHWAKEDSLPICAQKASSLSMAARE